ncbi:hypothetical protein BGX38DRAFT_1266770 [Terfezia claveryi]|nr:hypothetical protein BGX38DRAFT_1266770 [Terfezia claveryi]
MSSSGSLPQETIIQQSPAPRFLSLPIAEGLSLSASGRTATSFLDLPPEILTQISNETHAVDAYNLRLVHPQLYHLFGPENNLFWFKTTFKDYVVHYGPPPKPTPSDSETPDPVPLELSQLPFWDTLWRLNLLNRNADSVRGSSKHKEQLYKYDAAFKYFERIQSTLKEKRGCQVCCVGSYTESKYFGSIKRLLCTFCFDDMTINRPKMRFLKLEDDAYRFVRFRRKNGSVKYACWLPDVFRILPPDTKFTSIHDIERTYDAKYKEDKNALSEYKDKTREAVQQAAVEVYTKDPEFAGFRAVFPVEKMEDYVYGLETIEPVEVINRWCKKPRTKVWCVDIAKKSVLPQFHIVPDGNYQGPKKYAVNKEGKPFLIHGGRKMIVRSGVPLAIESAVFKYHEERFVRLGAGWDHRGMQADDKLMFGYCQICMDKKLRESGDLQKVDLERRKRKRDLADHGDSEREPSGIDAEGGIDAASNASSFSPQQPSPISSLESSASRSHAPSPSSSQTPLPSISQSPSSSSSQSPLPFLSQSPLPSSSQSPSSFTSQPPPPSFTTGTTSAYPTPLSPKIWQTSSPTPPSRKKGHKHTHTSTEVLLAKYLPQLYTAETAANFPTIPRRLISDPQQVKMIGAEQVKMTGAELAAHYLACHVDRFYSGEAEGPERRFERGKGGYWFWNLGEEEDVDMQDAEGNGSGEGASREESEQRGEGELELDGEGWEDNFGEGSSASWFQGNARRG